MAEYEQSSQLSDSVLKSSDVLYDLFCEVCSEDGKHVQAEGFCVDCSDYLCAGCYQIHRKTRATRNHVLQDQSTMPEKKPYAGKPSKDSCTEACEHHPEEIIKYYCRDHRTLGCSACMTVKHRVCEGVEYIQDIAAGLLTSQEYKLFEKELTDLNTMSKGVIKTSKTNITKAEKCCAEVHQSLKILRGDWNKAFDQFEINMKNQAEKHKSDDVQNMKAISDKGEDVLRTVEKISSDIQMLQKNNQLCQLFITVTQVKEKVGSLHHTLQETEEANSVQTYALKPSAEIQKMIISPATCGEITMDTANVTKEQRPLPGRPSDSQSSTLVVHEAAVHQRDITVRTKNDKTDCMISGCALLPENRLVLTDWNNDNVKLVNLKTLLVTSEFKTLKSCWGLTPISADQVAVTVPSDKKIQFMKVTDKLANDREMAVAGECRGIAYSSNKLYVSFENPAKIEIMTLHGTLERRLERDVGGSPLFKRPLCLSSSPDCHTLYVSDFDDASISRITLNGTVLTEYRDEKLSRPHGIVVDLFGKVIACGAASRNIHLLQPDCTGAKVLVSGLDQPWSLCYSEQAGQLYVGLGGNSVKVYQLS